LGIDDFEVINELSRAGGRDIPGAIKELQHKKVIHTTQCGKNEMKHVVEKFLGVR
jgi:hypothetical protein